MRGLFGRVLLHLLNIAGVWYQCTFFKNMRVFISLHISLSSFWYFASLLYKHSSKLTYFMGQIIILLKYTLLKVRNFENNI